MDLSALGSTLPPGLADVERDMGDKFRSSALSITTLYKASLSATKQAYHSGYSSCLTDVLSTVQSSIASGQDMSQTVSRLMDWVESRQAAMAAFAADESEEPASAASTSTPAPGPSSRRPAQTKHAVTRLQHQSQRPERPSSEPAPEHQAPASAAPIAHTGHSTPVAHSSAQPTWQPTPYASSSPSTSASGSVPRPVLLHANSSRKHHHSPIRSSHRAEQALIGHPPSSSFEPTLPQLPASGAPFITSSAPSSLSIGNKRALVDIEMEDAGSPPPRPGAGRASKRRSLGGHLAKGEETGEGDKDRDRDRRRGGRRGHGGGSSAAGGVGS